MQTSSSGAPLFPSRRLIIALISCAMLGGSASAAEPIIGLWRLPNGILIDAHERNGEYCGTVISGEFKGRSIGCVKGEGGRYRGQIIKVKDGKRYKGRAWVDGDVLAVSGCVLYILCQTELLTRQDQTASSN